MTDFIKPQGVRDAEAAAEPCETCSKLGHACPRHRTIPVLIEHGLLTAREKAQLRGWNIDPELTGGNPHGVNECECREHRREASYKLPVYGDSGFSCPCLCHGRTFQHYLRGA